MTNDERMAAYYATRDPRTPELRQRYSDALAKQRRDKFWQCIEEPATAPARSAESIVRNLLRATKRRLKR